MTRDSKKETRHENRCRKRPQLLFSTNKQPTVFMTSLSLTVSTYDSSCSSDKFLTTFNFQTVQNDKALFSLITWFCGIKKLTKKLGNSTSDGS